MQRFTWKIFTKGSTVLGYENEAWNGFKETRFGELDWIQLAQYAT